MKLTIDTEIDDLTAAIATLEILQFLGEQPYTSEILSYFGRHPNETPATVQALATRIPGADPAKLRAAWRALVARGLIHPGQPTRPQHDAPDEFTPAQP